MTAASTRLSPASTRSSRKTPRIQTSFSEWSCTVRSPLQHARRAGTVHHTSVLAYQQLVEIYQSTNQWQKAADVLQPLINDDPTNLDFQRQQAYFYLRAGLPEKARARFVALLTADPKDTRTQFYLAESLSDLEKYDQAERIYRQLLEKTPDDPDLLVNFGL